MSKPVYVTKSYLPPREEYDSYLNRIWSTHQLTNQGPLHQELNEALKHFLNVPYLQITGNGTLALQLALEALEIREGEIITTPFSYVATVGSVLWQRCTPVFVDIETERFCIDPAKIEEAVTPATRAILGVHVFGYPCDTDALAEIAERHDLKVIYDGAHAFGCLHRGRTLLSYGDISTCSFHATKVFHSGEGGCCIARRPEWDERLDLLKRFGHTADEYYIPGINAKNSEFHAAMGLCVLNHFDEIRKGRQECSGYYDSLLNGRLGRPVVPSDFEYNHSYYPVLFENEQHLLNVLAELAAQNIHPRRYFWPSLDRLPYLDGAAACPVSRDIASRVACLPLYPGLDRGIMEQIAGVILQ